VDLQSLRQEIDALDKAEWTHWPHAYGKGRDTVTHLAALLGDDVEAQHEAAQHFGSAIVHQSTLWPVSPDAFAWLVRLLRVKPLPFDVLDECLGALVESADHLGDVPTGTAIPELSSGARTWLEQFVKAPEDDYEELWEDFFEDGFDEEVYHWVLARMAALRPAVLELVTELADQAPATCTAVKESWQSE
jgi:hypothetical protein